MDSSFARSRRSANSWDHYVEVLVVADNKMLLYHQNNLENYVLTLFSTVASIYRHPSLHAAINIIVTRLIVLKHETIRKLCMVLPYYYTTGLFHVYPEMSSIEMLLFTLSVRKTISKCKLSIFLIT
ncbi:unnamed protein product [Wuchereria bancrofti]|uniref:Uncharacterized protein n=1 Tax=Wuchereria bancrofti TaxID=6293 RepID=A0A3P7EFU2_WUCBA|nr:unnamed protein product [Wuchereria bancrofti]